MTRCASSTSRCAKHTEPAPRGEQTQNRITPARRVRFCVCSPPDKAGELACKPDSVIWAFVPFSCVGGVVTVLVRRLVLLATESCCQLYCGRSADGLRTVAGTVPPFPMGSRFTRTTVMRVEGGLTWCRAGVVRCSGARIAQSSQPHATVSHAAVDLVVLTKEVRRPRSDGLRPPRHGISAYEFRASSRWQECSWLCGENLQNTSGWRTICRLCSGGKIPRIRQNLSA